VRLTTVQVKDAGIGVYITVIIAPIIRRERIDTSISD
tara:strand:- start:1461 stop:1571 length:111 start_codon:yes stop_codon:yes gene_type:complete